MVDTAAVENLVLSLQAAGRSPLTVENYQRYARRLMAQTRGQQPTRHDIQRFMAAQAERQRPQSLRVVYYIVKQLHEVNDWQWPLRRGELPGAGQSNPPVLSISEVGRLVAATRTIGTPDQRAYLAVSTTYGLRRAEITSIRPGDINEKIFIRTVKRGVQREHSIPPEVRGWIEGFEWTRLKTSQMSQRLADIYKLAGLYHRHGVGWHAIRRALATELIANGANEINVARFLRWKVSHGFGVLPNYVRTPDEAIDEAIFSRHPFVRFWK